MIPVLKVFKVQRVTTALMELPVRKAILVRLVLKDPKAFKVMQVRLVHKVQQGHKVFKDHKVLLV